MSVRILKSDEDQILELVDAVKAYDQMMGRPMSMGRLLDGRKRMLDAAVKVDANYAERLRMDRDSAS